MNFYWDKKPKSLFHKRSDDVTDVCVKCASTLRTGFTHTIKHSVIYLLKTFGF